MKKTIISSLASLLLIGSCVGCVDKTPKTFKAYFYDETGTKLIQETTFTEGEKPTFPANPTKEEDNTYTYTFDKWVDAIGSDKEVNFLTATSDTNAYAKFIETYKDYSITFVLNNGEPNVVQSLHYGDAIVPPTNFAKLGYTFKCWDKEVSKTVTGNETYSAVWEINKYTVTWKNGTETIEVDEGVEYGASPSFDGETPTKEKSNGYTYVFKGWGLSEDGEVIDLDKEKVTDNKTYYALFDSSKEAFNVTFVNEGTVISTKSYFLGDEVIVPATPAKEADENYIYKFAGWDKEVTTVSESVTYTATYTPYRYKDGFVTKDEGLTLTNEIFAGSNVIKASGMGEIHFKDAFLETDTFFENYTYLSFEFLYGAISTDNMIYTTGASSWFRTDYVEDNGIKNVSDLIRVYENGNQVFKMYYNNWYTFSMLVRKSDAGQEFKLENVFLNLYGSAHTVYLRNLRFGNEWLIDTFEADPLGFISETSGVTMEVTKKDDVDVIKATSKTAFAEGENGNVCFKNVYDNEGEKEFFYRNYNSIRFQLFVESDDGSDKFFHTTWAQWSWINFAGFCWTSDEKKEPFFSSYNVEGTKVNSITVGSWYTIEIKANHSGNRADNVAKLDISHSTCYFKNLEFFNA